MDTELNQLRVLVLQQLTRTGQILSQAKRTLPEFVFAQVLTEHDISQYDAATTMAMFRQSQH
jgi:hypothetical protein